MIKMMLLMLCFGCGCVEFVSSSLKVTGAPKLNNERAKTEQRARQNRTLGAPKVWLT
jgi:hypothetical protein